MKKINLNIILKRVKEASKIIANLSSKQKNELLLAMANELLEQKTQILQANKQDILEAKKANLTEAFIDRLTLTDKGFQAMIDQLKTLATMSDYVGEIMEEKNLPNGIHLVKRRFPIGVILMIYESRPNVTIDAAGLCLKSGNAVLLKGGSEAKNTNAKLIQCLHEALKKFNLPLAIITFLDNISHKEVNHLLQQDKFIDVVIPRGSYNLTTSVAKNAHIPILYHASGGARMYVDASADLQKALSICLNAKTQRTGVCNALDVLVVHKDIAANFLPLIDKVMFEKQFEVRADKEAKRYMLHAKQAKNSDFETEFLDTILAVKVVDNINLAIFFIKTHSHGHTEVLVANNKKVIDQFVSDIDAAGLMINCSSRLHDGGEFGMGAEMGTATGKLHARGPVGIKELTTYKWIAYGSGQIRD